MNFIDDVHLVATRHGRVLCGLKQLAHFINFGIGRRIDFQQIHKTARINILAGLAHTARRGGHATFAVGTKTIQRFRQNTRQRGLANAARSGEQIGVMDTPSIQRIGQRPDHVLLPNHVNKVAWSPFTRKNLVAHRLSLKRRWGH